MGSAPYLRRVGARVGACWMRSNARNFEPPAEEWDAGPVLAASGRDAGDVAVIPDVRDAGRSLTDAGPNPISRTCAGLIRERSRFRARRT